MNRITPCLLTVAVFASGCTQIEDHRIRSQHRRLAYSAWSSNGGGYCHVSHLVDFQKGFIDGYADVASGGDGCPPALPPKKYWGAAYQTPSGKEHVKAWFAGFREGAAAAKRDGVETYSSIYVSPEHRQAQQQNANGNYPTAVPMMSPVPQTVVQPTVPPPPPTTNANPTLLAPPPAVPQPMSPEPKKPMSKAPTLAPPPKTAPMAKEKAPASGASNISAPQAKMKADQAPTKWAVAPAPIWPTTAPASSTEKQPTKTSALPTKETKPSVDPFDVPPPPSFGSKSVGGWMAEPTSEVKKTTVAKPPVAAPKTIQTVKAKPELTLPDDPAKSVSVVKKVESKPAVEKKPVPKSEVKSEVQKVAAQVPVSQQPVVKATKEEIKNKVSEAPHIPAFVKPLSDVPAGFVPEVILGKPVNLNPDGTIVGE